MEPLGYVSNYYETKYSLEVLLNLEQKTSKCSFRNFHHINNLVFEGFGRWSKNGFLSFIEDTIFPFPFCQKMDEGNFVNVEKMSWKRRVDVNMAFYVILLMVLMALNIYYKTISKLFKDLEKITCKDCCCSTFQCLLCRENGQVVQDGDELVD